MCSCYLPTLGHTVCSFDFRWIAEFLRERLGLSAGFPGETGCRQDPRSIMLGVQREGSTECLLLFVARILLRRGCWRSSQWCLRMWQCISPGREWGTLDKRQKELYRDVMRMNYELLSVLGKRSRLLCLCHHWRWGPAGSSVCPCCPFPALSLHVGRTFRSLHLRTFPASRCCALSLTLHPPVVIRLPPLTEHLQCAG